MNWLTPQSTVFAVRNACLNIQKLHFAHSADVLQKVFILVKTAVISLNGINRLVFATEI
jgi:hypothetical protein